MNEHLVKYLNANVHKIAHFKVEAYCFSIEFVNGDEVQIHVDDENGNLKLVHIVQHVSE
ncbi:hypothetical protein [Paenibacillus alvei]|uniref:hypothetical protein n=1 Tax=Paenibacillus alvei TaxID=44250 RepID=UPI0013DB6D22|nr:hypothetical protein [Paenibacillus alvei]NEZ45451.1 hypothetical protein [Paenibacillus alvei]